MYSSKCNKVFHHEKKKVEEETEVGTIPVSGDEGRWVSGRSGEGEKDLGNCWIH